jgi:hypothetical protein
MLNLIFPGKEPELCADGIALVGKGTYMVGTDLVKPSELSAAERLPRPVNPGLTTFVPLRPSLLGWGPLRNFLSMQPATSLDKWLFFLPPSIVGGRSLSDLGRDADHLGMPVQYPAAQLTEEPPGALENAADRVRYLDLEGNPVDLAAADIVQVEPLNRRGANAYDEVMAGAVKLAPAQRLDRLVHTLTGVQLGLAPGLVNRMLTEVLGGGPRPAGQALAPATELGDLAFTAAGVTDVHTAQGYAELSRAVRDLPAGAQAVIVVEGAATGVFQVVKDPATDGLMLVDTASAAPGELPKEADTIRYGRVPEGQSFAETLEGLRADLYGTDTTAPSWVATTRDEVQKLQWIDSSGTLRTVEVLGSTLGLPAVGRTAQERVDQGKFQDGVMDLAEQSDRSMIVLGVDHPGEPVPLALLDSLAHRVGVHVLDGDVPLVVTNGTVNADLRAELDKLHADLVYQAPGLSSGGGLLNLGLPPWAVRVPGAEPDETAAIADELADDAIVDAVRQRPAPAVEAPARELSALVTTSVTSATREQLVERLNSVRSLTTDQRPAATELAGLTSAFRPQAALLHIDHVGGREETLDWLQNPTEAAAMLGPLLNVSKATEDVTVRETQVRALLPELAALARHGVNDEVSMTIAEKLNGLFTGEISETEARTAILGLAGKLVNETVIRNKWVTALHEMSRLLPQHSRIFTWVAEAILDCP